MQNSPFSYRIKSTRGTAPRTTFCYGLRKNADSQKMSNKTLNHLLMALTILFDFCFVATAILVAYWLRFISGWFEAIALHKGGTPPLAEYFRLIPIMAGIWLLTLKALKLYQPESNATTDAFWQLCKAALIALIATLGALFFIYHHDAYSRWVMLIATGLSLMWLFLGRLVLTRFRQTIYAQGVGVNRIAIVGYDERVQKFINALWAKADSGYQLIGIIDTVGEPPQSPDPVGETSELNTPAPVGETSRSRFPIGEPSGLDYPPVGEPPQSPDPVGETSRSRFPIGEPLQPQLEHLGHNAEAHHIVQKHRLDILFIASPTVQNETILQILRDCEGVPVQINMFPELSEFITGGTGVSYVEGTPVIQLRDTPMQGMRGIVKRAIDIIFSAAALIVLSPLMLAIAMAIRLTSPGKAIFRQERTGRAGKRFQIYKFRSMRADAEENVGHIWAKPDDARQTSLGKFLRRWSLDELPQFFNVLKGDMSLVGPRPEMSGLIPTFRDSIPHYLARQRVKAGMTGWAQVNGLRGNTSLEERICYDRDYIENWSLGLDMKIIFKTLWAIKKGPR